MFIRSQTLVLGDDGIVSLRAGCRQSQPCTGFIALYQETKEIGRADFSVGALRAGTVDVALTPAAIREIRKRRTVSKIQATVVVEQGDGNHGAISPSDPLTIKSKPKTRKRSRGRR